MPKVRDPEAEAKAKEAEAKAEIDWMLNEQWRRMQEQNKPTQGQPLRQDAQADPDDSLQKKRRRSKTPVFGVHGRWRLRLSVAAENLCLPRKERSP